MKLTNLSVSIPFFFALSACQTTVNLGPLSATDGTDTAAGSETASDTESEPPVLTLEPEPSTTSTTGESTTGSDTGDSTEGTNTSSTTSTTASESGDSNDATGTTGTSGTDSDTGGVQAGCEAPWTRVRPVTIVNEPDRPLNDFQVHLKIAYDEDMKFDYGDLRFFDAMGAALPYWIESSTVPIDARVWVRVPTIPAAGETEIVMCYGNPAATGESDGKATFVFFDGFDDGVLDTDAWETANTPEFADGKIKITKSPVYSKLPPGQMPNLLVEARTDSVASIMMVSSSQLGDLPFIQNGWDGWHEGANKDGIKTMQGKFIDMFVSNGIIGVAADEGNLYATRFRQQRASGAGGWKGPFFIGLGGLKFNNQVEPLSLDWVLVRKFASIEPTVEIGAESAL
ncbi:DUF2341 domain-containing protein [Nannocystis radixulma]|uniref:DUF2341 domain-containing protein n=1 Tax=Nannocystis radixulma TaxID=2995305 RepID=A0ABT5B8H3_9BACT|nr:DUF2341 domain-containing protein [Nannocystis radixulma]MDC0669824.1 DUF2341 domain-containing protein [Nannocystis radixulma]